MKKQYITSWFFFLIVFTSFSQATWWDKAKKQTNIPVMDEAGQLLKYPWAGGLNSVQFNAIDLNLDGIMDLVIFDRAGNILLPFINGGTPDSIDYHYDPSYVLKFPMLENWMILKDYDGDGKVDIFAHSNYGGMAVYRNVSDTTLKFQLKTNLLTSYYYSSYINILVTDVDFPAIYDIDGDGDLDILTFFGLGSFVEHHINLSMEKYGVPDSLDFKMVDKCWGHFMESESSNVLTLNVPCPYREESIEGEMLRRATEGRDGTRHVGSTFLLMDINDDDVVDLVLGDVDYPMLVLLINGGTSDSAWMVSQDTNFPTIDHPLRLITFPVASYLDINNDGINEMLASPFDPNPAIARNLGSVWHYANDGTNSLPDFRFVREDEFQKDMIDVGGGAFPTVVDENGDGLPDIIIGNYGVHDSSWYAFGFLYSSFRSSLSLYRNVGTAASPAFRLITRDYAGLASRNIQGISPSFVDLDGDGDLDMLIGKDDGTFDFYKNTAGPGQPMQLVLETIEYQGLDVGKASAPFFVDLDGDSLLDLVSGNKEGTLVYFRNTGTPSNPVFTHITDSLGKVDVRDAQLSYSGYSYPAFYCDSNNNMRLLVGCSSGTVFYYEDIDASNLSEFTLKSNFFQLIDEGNRSTPVVADMDGDGLLDLIVGNYRGGLAYFASIASIPSGIPSFEPQGFLPLKVYPNPANQHITVELSSGHVWKADLSVMDLSGRTVITQDYNGRNIIELPLDELSPGLYLLRANFSTPEGNKRGMAYFVRMK